MKKLGVLKNIKLVGATGVNAEEFKSFIQLFTDPIQEVLLWVIPSVAVIAAIIMGLMYFFKTEQEKEEFEIIGKLIKMGIVAAILQSVAIVFRILGVV